jgi:hypothetical protein
MFSFLAVKHSIEVSNDQSKVISGIVSLLENVSYAQIEHLHGFIGLFFDVKVVSLHLKSSIFE